MNIEIVCESDISGVVMQAIMALFEFEVVAQTDLGGGETLTNVYDVVVKDPYPDLEDCVINVIE